MKKLLLSTTLLVGLLSIQAHADYVSPSSSVASQAAQYSTMDINGLIKAAKAGQAGAQFYLATKYQQGKDVQQDSRQAFAWYKAAADQGLSAAQLNVGRMLADGIGTKKDEVLARQYFGDREAWIAAICAPWVPTLVCNILKKQPAVATTAQALTLP